MAINFYYTLGGAYGDEIMFHRSKSILEARKYFIQSQNPRVLAIEDSTTWKVCFDATEFNRLLADDKLKKSRKDEAKNAKEDDSSPPLSVYWNVNGHTVNVPSWSRDMRAALQTVKNLELVGRAWIAPEPLSVKKCQGRPELFMSIDQVVVYFK